MVDQLRRAREREAELNRLERFTALGQLAGALAHEIKNPLNFISLAIDQLRARYAPQLQNDQDNYRRQLAVMKDEVHRLSELIQSFLNYGRPIEVHPAPTDVRALVGNVLELSDSKLRSQSIHALQQGAEAPVILNVDAEKLHACFINVVANAIQAMPEGGELKIAFWRDVDNEVITFSDTGAGIDPEVASHVFEPFFTTKREGIGLGLFFSRAIVERHGGTIRIGSNPAGRGTTVTFILPLGALGKHT
jgi:signal transduction histidine kinase